VIGQNFPNKQDKNKSYRLVFSKAAGRWTAKFVHNEKKSFASIKDMMTMCVWQKGSMTLCQKYQ
jgi:hypothetical protein